MSEHEEAIVRSQAILMLARNYNRRHVIRRVLKRFMNCIRK